MDSEGIGLQDLDREFVAAEPVGKFALPDRVLQSFCYCNQQLVSGTMTQPAVDLLEPVQIQME